MILRGLRRYAGLSLTLYECENIPCVYMYDMCLYVCVCDSRMERDGRTEGRREGEEEVFLARRPAMLCGEVDQDLPLYTGERLENGSGCHGDRKSRVGENWGFRRSLGAGLVGCIGRWW